MNTILRLRPALARQLGKIAAESNKDMSSLADDALSQFVHSHRETAYVTGTRAKLQELERHHGMSTDAFLQRFEAGELGDADEWFDWEAIAALKAEAERKLGELERAGV